MGLYDLLLRVTPSPLELKRAVAVSMGFGPAAGLERVDALNSEPALGNYHLLPSVRGDLLAKLGRFEAARAEFERGASLTQNMRERELLLDRARSSLAKSNLAGGQLGSGFSRIDGVSPTV